jgi:RNA polymerase sigma factor (sigma-70 family)
VRHGPNLTAGAQAALSFARAERIVLPAMPRREEWLDACAEIRGAEEPLSSPAWACLYRLALEDGRALLRWRFRDIPDSGKDDLVHDVLATAWEQVVNAENPRGLFIVALQNRALDLLRRGGTRSVGQVDLDTLQAESASDEVRNLALDTLDALLELPPRDREVLLASAAGEDGTEIARRHGMSEANAYQIISRTRRSLKARLESTWRGKGGP